MKVKKLFINISALFLSFLFFINLSFSQENQKQDAYTIMKKVDNSKQPKDIKSELTMILINKQNKKRIRTIKSYKKGDEKQLIYFLKPADVKGVSFLRIKISKNNDKMFLYLPAFKKTRRITGSQKNQSFMGSDFTYNDIGGYDIDDFKYTLKGETTIDNKPCYIIKAVPLPKTSLKYSKILYYIWKNEYKILKAEFVKNNKVEKIMSFKDYKKIKNYLIPVQIIMENKRRKHKTILKFDKIKVNTGISDSLFSLNNLKHIR